MKMNSILALFIVLVIILFINPRIIFNIYSTIIGRLILLCIVIFLAMNNVTLGLLVAFIIIIVLNEYGSLTEGFENTELPPTTTVGEENVPITGQQKVLTKTATKKLSELKEEASMGIDQEDIKNAIAAKNSNTIPLDPNTMSSEDVSAHAPNMISNSSSLTEGFCPYAASVTN